MVGLSKEPWISCAVEVAPPQMFGSPQGFERRCVPIVSAVITGRINGRGLPGGTDWQRILPSGVAELEAHYALETDQGELMEVYSNGMRSGPEEAMRDLLAGRPVDPALIYFRSAMRFISDAPRLRDFTTRLFIGVGRRDPTRVYLEVHAVE